MYHRGRDIPTAQLLGCVATELDFCGWNPPGFQRLTFTAILWDPREPRKTSCRRVVGLPEGSHRLKLLAWIVLQDKAPRPPKELAASSPNPEPGFILGRRSPTRPKRGLKKARKPRIGLIAKRDAHPAKGERSAGESPKPTASRQATIGLLVATVYFDWPTMVTRVCAYSKGTLLGVL